MREASGPLDHVRQTRVGADKSQIKKIIAMVQETWGRSPICLSRGWSQKVAWSRHVLTMEERRRITQARRDQHLGLVRSAARNW